MQCCRRRHEAPAPPCTDGAVVARSPRHRRGTMALCDWRRVVSALVGTHFRLVLMPRRCRGPPDKYGRLLPGRPFKAPSLPPNSRPVAVGEFCDDLLHCRIERFRVRTGRRTLLERIRERMNPRGASGVRECSICKTYGPPPRYDLGEPITGFTRMPRLPAKLDWEF